MVIAPLPDGKPIAVLCRQVEQATTDTNGSAGFSATAQANDWLEKITNANKNDFTGRAWTFRSSS